MIFWKIILTLSASGACTQARTRTQDRGFIHSPDVDTPGERGRRQARQTGAHGKEGVIGKEKQHVSFDTQYRSPRAYNMLLRGASLGRDWRHVAPPPSSQRLPKNPSRAPPSQAPVWQHCFIYFDAPHVCDCASTPTPTCRAQADALLLRRSWESQSCAVRLPACQQRPARNLDTIACVVTQVRDGGGQG